MREAGIAVLSGVSANPSVAAGVCIFAVAFTMVAGNALYGQRGGHPFPLFQTRDHTVTRSVPDPAPEGAKVVGTARPKPVAEQKVPVPAMRPRGDRVVVEAKPAPAGSQPVMDAQAQLKAAGFYTGEVDGLLGPKTRDAVLRFEAAAGLAATGKVDEALARRIEAWREKPAKAVVQREAPAAEAASETPPAVTLDIRDARDAALIARIQIGLINSGETGISVDGLVGEDTIDAIRRFQERVGLEITGAPDAALLQKLMEVGALKNG